MKKRTQYSIFLVSLIMLMACGTSSDSKEKDTTSYNPSKEDLIKTFEELFTTNIYKKYLDKGFVFDKSKHQWTSLTGNLCLVDKESSTSDRKFTELCLEKSYTSKPNNVLIGDLNGDGLNDGILAYTTSGFGGGGNNWMRDYAIFLNNGTDLKYKCNFPAGDKFSDYINRIHKIQESKVLGLIEKNVIFGERQVLEEKSVFELEGSCLIRTSPGPKVVKFICEVISTIDSGTPKSAVYLQINSEKRKIAEIAACTTYTMSDFPKYQIPSNALAACGGWFAGGGDYFYAIQEKDEVVVYKGWQDEGQTDDSFHYEKVK